MGGTVRTYVILIVACLNVSLARELGSPYPIASTIPWATRGHQPTTWQFSPPPRSGVHNGFPPNPALQAPATGKIPNPQWTPPHPTQPPQWIPSQSRKPHQWTTNLPPTQTPKPTTEKTTIPPPPADMGAAIDDLSNEANKLQHTIENLLNTKKTEVDTLAGKQGELQKQQNARKNLTAVISQVSQASKDNKALRERFNQLEAEKRRVEQQLQANAAKSHKMKMTSITDTTAIKRFETEMKKLQASRLRTEKENQMLRAQLYENEAKNDNLRYEVQKTRDSRIFGIDNEKTIAKFMAERRGLDEEAEEVKAQDQNLNWDLNQLFNVRPGSPDFMAEKAHILQLAKEHRTASVHAPDEHDRATG